MSNVILAPAPTTEVTAHAVNNNGRHEPTSLISMRDLWKTYVMGSEKVHALHGVSFDVKKGEYIAITGPSGSGKSTLMNLVGCLDTPSQGEYWLNGKNVSEMDDDELARIRNQEVGFVFQHLNPESQNATSTDEQISEAMATYWTNFAKYGNPDGNGVPAWPAFSEANPVVMYFNQTPHTGTVPSAESLKVLDEYFKWRRTPEGNAWAK